jgi:hypothetical protein
MDVIDDWKAESDEVYRVNTWVSHTAFMHLVREMGGVGAPFDELDSRTLTAAEQRRVAEIIHPDPSKPVPRAFNPTHNRVLAIVGYDAPGWSLGFVFFFLVWVAVLGAVFLHYYGVPAGYYETLRDAGTTVCSTVLNETGRKLPGCP